MRMILKAYLPFRQEIAPESVREKLDEFLRIIGRKTFDPENYPFHDGVIFDTHDWALKINLDIPDDTGLSLVYLRDGFQELVNPAAKYLRSGGAAVAVYDPEEINALPSKSTYMFAADAEMRREMGKLMMHGALEPFIYRHVGRLDFDAFLEIEEPGDEARFSATPKAADDTWTRDPRKRPSP